MSESEKYTKFETPTAEIKKFDKDILTSSPGSTSSGEIEFPPVPFE